MTTHHEHDPAAGLDPAPLTLPPGSRRVTDTPPPPAGLGTAEGAAAWLAALEATHPARKPARVDAGAITSTTLGAGNKR